MSYQPPIFLEDMSEDSPDRRSEPYQPQHQSSPSKQIANGTNEQQSTGISGLRQSRNVGRLLVCDIEILCHLVKYGMVVVEISHRKCSSKSWILSTFSFFLNVSLTSKRTKQQIQRHRELELVFGIVTTSFGRICNLLIELAQSTLPSRIV